MVKIFLAWNDKFLYKHGIHVLPIYSATYFLLSCIGNVLLQTILLQNMFQLISKPNYPYTKYFIII